MNTSTSLSSSRRPAADAPAYTVAEASRYLKVNAATLRSWVIPASPIGSSRDSVPPFLAAETDPLTLSFNNLVEAHVFSAIRENGVSSPKARKSIGYLQREFGTARPLLEEVFETDGVDLFVDKLGRLLQVSTGGQVALRDLLRGHLRRIERAPVSGLRFFPFTRYKHSRPDPEGPRMIVIDPRIAFGRPVVDGTGVRAAIIGDRFQAGESIDELADDLEIRRELVEEAVRWRESAA